jgi:hypothetical protein
MLAPLPSISIPCTAKRYFPPGMSTIPDGARAPLLLTAGGAGAGAGVTGTRHCCSYAQASLSDCSGVAVIAFIFVRNAASS